MYTFFRWALDYVARDKMKVLKSFDFGYSFFASDVNYNERFFNYIEIETVVVEDIDDRYRAYGSNL